MIKYAAILFALIITTSCQQVRDKAMDKVSPIYNSDKPDTEYNKKRFEEHFGFAPGAGITNIYAYADEMGIDSKYQFGFMCDTVSLNRIIHKLQLKEKPVEVNPRGITRNFPWWDSTYVADHAPYWDHENDRYFYYLWYDTTAGNAYYLTFDL